MPQQELTLLIHLHSKYTPLCPICPWTTILTPKTSILPQKILQLYSKLNTLGYRVRETHLLCPNPLDHKEFKQAYKTISEESKRVYIWLNIYNLTNFKLGIVNEEDRILLITPSYPKLKQMKEKIHSLISHGYENIEILFTLIPGVNDLDITQILDFCKLRSLKLKISEPLFTEERYNIIPLLSRIKHITLSENKKRIFCSYYRYIAFYKEDYPFQIIHREEVEQCNLIYMHNTSTILKCPLTQKTLAKTPKELEKIPFKCPHNPQELKLTPIIKIELMTPEGIIINSEILQILNLLDKHRSIREIARTMQTSHTKIRRTILKWEKKLKTKLVKYNPYTKQITLTETAKTIVNKYNQLTNKLKQIKQIL